MKTIKKDELFRNLGGFLKSKGIELNDGSYTTHIQQGCNLLSDAINATQKTVKKTKVKVDEALDHLRESIHQSTGPPTVTPSQKQKRGKASREACVINRQFIPTKRQSEGLTSQVREIVSGLS